MREDPYDHSRIFDGGDDLPQVPATVRAMLDIDAQHRREQLGVHGEEDAKPDRKRQHPLPDRHVRDELIDPLRGALNHAPVVAREAKSAALARKRDQFLMCALGTAYSQLQDGLQIFLEHLDRYTLTDVLPGTDLQVVPVQRLRASRRRAP